MAITPINVGTSANDGTGDPHRTAFQKINNNVNEITTNGGTEITVIDPTTVAAAPLNDALQNVYDSVANVPTLQQVTDEGNETTNEIKANFYELYDTPNGLYAKIKYNDGQFEFYDISDNLLFVLVNDGTEVRYNNSNFRLTKNVNDLTSNRTRTEPDKNGTYAMLDDMGYTVVSSNTNASNDTNYTVVANATFTDPTPTEGKGYVVYVRNGTATIGGTGYAAGSLVYRVYHSGAWSSVNLGLKQDALTETNFGSFSNGLTSKNTLVDADTVNSSDSADSNKAKKTTWLNVWTNYIKTKSDSVYQAILTAANFGSFSNGLTSKTTPVDADTFNIVDSADSNNAKKLSFANFKTSLLTYFYTVFRRPLVEISTASAAHTGTTSETQISAYNFQLPANSIDKFLRLVSFGFEKTGTNNVAIVRLKINSTNNYGTATTIATGTISAANNYYKLSRTFKIDGGNLKGVSFTAVGTTDQVNTSAGSSTTAFDKTNIVYGFVSIQLNSAADSVTLEELLIMN